MGNKVFTFGDIRIREVKGKYYVYVIEKNKDGQRTDCYVGPLDKVIEFYVSSGGLGVSLEWTGRDLNPGPLGCQPSTLPG
ncbi:integrase [Sulfolobus islandicus REY15A]|uniref:Integrase n=1 Tax=Saccharolobus islandicus (strain REY15A) TaxID=930945 RepID=F0NHT8_SACI5|nr:integrase [Sulfolobus islandicus REY15A]